MIGEKSSSTAKDIFVGFFVQAISLVIAVIYGENTYTTLAIIFFGTAIAGLIAFIREKPIIAILIAIIGCGAAYYFYTYPEGPDRPPVVGDIYDDFENPAYNEGLNSDLWEITNESPRNCAKQQNGVLEISSEIFTEYGCNLFPPQHQFLAIEGVQAVEAKLMLGNQNKGNVEIHLTAAYPNNEYWFTHCYLDGNSGEPFIECGHVFWPINDDVYYTGKIETGFGVWHTARIEIDPETLEFKYYIDGEFQGSHVPIFADELRRKSFLFTVGGFSSFIDDVRISTSSEKVSYPSSPPTPTSTQSILTLTPRAGEEVWAVSYIYRFAPGFWSIGNHTYNWDTNCPNSPPESSGLKEETFRVSDQAKIFPGDVYLRPYDVYDGILEANKIYEIHPSQPTTAALSYPNATLDEIKSLMEDCTVRLRWDNGEWQEIYPGMPYIP